MEQDRDTEERLVEAFLTDGDGVFSREKAVLHLNMECPDVFPIRDDERDQWVVSAETDSLDGCRFISSMTAIEEDAEACPECGNDRVRASWFDNGVVGGHRRVCTVCEYVHEEDAG